MENHLRLFLLLRLFLQYLRCLIRSSGILLAETQNLIANDNQVTVFQKRRHRQRIAVEFRPVGAAQIFDTPFPCGIQADLRVITRNAADKKLDIIVRLPADTDSGRRNLFRFTGPGTIQKIKFPYLNPFFHTGPRSPLSAGAKHCRTLFPFRHPSPPPDPRYHRMHCASVLLYRKVILSHKMPFCNRQTAATALNSALFSEFYGHG